MGICFYVALQWMADGLDIQIYWKTKTYIKSTIILKELHSQSLISTANTGRYQQRISHRYIWISFWKEKTDLQNKTWSVNNGEIGAVCVFSSHDYWFRWNGSLNISKVCLSSGSYQVSYSWWKNHRIAIFFWIFILISFQKQVSVITAKPRNLYNFIIY